MLVLRGASIESSSHRQRYQHRLKHMGRHSTLSDEREHILSCAGFIWDSHRAAWFERFQALKAFRNVHGHCNLPSAFHDASLVLWCKHQRRQYKHFKQGLKSTITKERIRHLESIGFRWNPRNLKSRPRNADLQLALTDDGSNKN